MNDLIFSVHPPMCAKSLICSLSSGAHLSPVTQTGRMCDYSLYYSMAKSKLGVAVIINNLEAEQEPTKKDVDAMGNVLRDIGSSPTSDSILFSVIRI